MAGADAPAAQADVPVAQADGDVTAGGFTVRGGTAATSLTAGDGDFFFDGTTLHILTSTPLTVSTAAQTAHNIQVEPGVKADLTLAGVNIRSSLAPINLVTNSDEDGDGKKVTNAADIKNKTTLHLTLADGTANSLSNTVTGANGWPGLRVGWGSVLVIDDSVTNVRQGGSKFNLDDIVTPVDGMVAAAVTLLGGKQLAAGAPLADLEAANPGSLTVRGGGHSAGIGSGPKENAGTIVVNGGVIDSAPLAFTGSNWGYANGSGIGGGGGGSATITIFNGGRVTASGGSCGTGIGAGFGYGAATDHHVGSTCKSDAIEVPYGAANSHGYSWHGPVTDPGPNFQTDRNDSYHTYAGEVTINGGYITANAATHGNAVGQPCAHGPASNTNHIIRVTGGTLITHLTNDQINSTNPTLYGIGARNGYTIVTGGSVYVQSRGGSPLFQGIGGTAYNTTGVETWDDVEAMGGSLPDSDKVQMLSIDLSSRFGSGENMTVPVTKWELEIDNIAQDYGAPSYLNDGKLYLWVPESATGKNVTVTMSYRDDEGVEHNIEPMYVEEVGGSSGSLLKAYVDIDIDKLEPTQQAYFNGLVKDYDGLSFAPLAVSKEHPIDTTGMEENPKKLDDPSAIETSYQAYDEKGGSPLPGSSVIRDNVMPSDTGTYRIELISKQYANTLPFGNNYWGHRITGWATINPVPAVLEIEKAEWGYLDVDAAKDDPDAWTPIVKDQETGGIAGNRLKLVFNVRSANTTALTCAAPTGEFQVRIDGKAVGDPIKLTAEDIAKSPHSTFGQEDIAVKSPNGGTETRHATVVTYYLDPANRDGLLDLLESAGNGDEHKVNIEYIADKNYIKGVDKNPDNAQEDNAFIVPVPPKGDVGSDDPDKVKVEDTPTPDPGPGGTDPSDPSNPGDPSNPSDPDGTSGKTQVIRKTITVNYRDFHQEGVDLEDFFPLELTSTSSVKPVYGVSNAAVATLIPAEEGKPAFGQGGTPALDEQGRLKIQVNSCGTSVITAEQKPNALYTGLKYILTVKVVPDPTLKPQVQIRLTWRNLTALAEAAPQPAVAAARSVLAAGDEALGRAGFSSRMARAAADRTHTPPRPGDVLEYTVTGLNLTPGSAWQAAELKDAIDQQLTLDMDSVQIASNYATRTDKSTALGSDAFYEGFDWDDLGWADVDQKDFSYVAPELTKGIDTVYGGQSTSVRFRATVAEDEGLGDRPGEDGKLPEITNTPGGGGSYGKPEGELKPGETPTDPAPLDPDKDIEIIGGSDPKPGEPSTVEPTPVLPKDPAAADIVTTVEVEQKGHREEHDADRILVGDTLGVTVTSTNTAKDSCLTDAVVKVTLPVGMEPKEGTIKLVDGEGNVHDVPMDAYDPKTGIIAVNAGDLYGGEKAVLTFDVDVVSVHDPDAPDGSDDPDNPDVPSDPDDPSAPGNPDDPTNPDDPDNPGTPGPTRPTAPVIEGGTLGGTPTDEWEREHPTDPDVEPADPADKPEPGTPFEPGKPWEDLEDEFVSTPPAVDPTMPPVLPASPKLEDDKEGPADITVSKEAQNLNSADGTTHVGDVVRYTITVRNAAANTIWYDVVIRDDVPVGLEPLSGSLRLVDRAGVEREVPDSAYSVDDRRLAVSAGDLRGEGVITLTFDALVTEDAVQGDIGNVAEVFGTTPAGVDVGTVGEGVERPVGGTPFEPEDGWDAFEKEHPALSNPAPSYPAGVTEKGGVIAEPRPEPDGTGDGQDGAGSRTPIRLAQTGDELAAPAVALVMAAAAAGVMLTALMAQRSRRRQELRARYAGRW